MTHLLQPLLCQSGWLIDLQLQGAGLHVLWVNMERLSPLNIMKKVTAVHYELQSFILGAGLLKEPGGFSFSAVVADGWNKARMLLVSQPVSDSRGEEEGWRWDGRPGGGVWTDKAWVWQDELKTGHLTLVDNNLTNSSLSPCVRTDSHLGRVSHALKAFCPFPSNELNDIIFVSCAAAVSERLKAKKQKRHCWLILLARCWTDWSVCLFLRSLKIVVEIKTRTFDSECCVLLLGLGQK